VRELKAGISNGGRVESLLNQKIGGKKEKKFINPHVLSPMQTQTKNQTKPKNRIEIKKINDETISVRIRKRISIYEDDVVHEVEVVQKIPFEDMQEFIKNLTTGTEVYWAGRKYQLGPVKDVVIIETDGYMDVYGDEIVDYVLVYMALRQERLHYRAMQILAAYYLPDIRLHESMINMAILSLPAADFSVVADLLLTSINVVCNLKEWLKEAKEKALRCGNR
jgi:hypothetical protein